MAKSKLLVMLIAGSVAAFACGDDGAGNAPGGSDGGDADDGGAEGIPSGGSQLSQGGDGSGAAAGNAPQTAAGEGGSGELGGVGGTGDERETGGQGGAGRLDSCGKVERCEAQFLGLDDDCNGQVDEGCSCSPGQAHACFIGDSQYRGTGNCIDGTERCTELGSFGPCEGGVHATPGDACYDVDPAACQPLTVLPFADVDLSTGSSSFGQGTDGAEFWSVDCPSGVTPCPAPQGAGGNEFKPIASGEYTVTYTTSINQVEKSCSYPLIVKAAGLRVELDWEKPSSGHSSDLDLYLHRPNDVQPWTGTAVCNYESCLAGAFSISPNGLAWFAQPPAVPPVPVNWYLLPTKTDNSCYNAPINGATWEGIGMGCHNPRLDLDRIQCDPAETDPTAPSFCFPENANIDFPPLGQWLRIAVHYFSGNSQVQDVHPTIRVFCGGALAAELGRQGYYDPEVPVSFEPATGVGVGDSRRFWQVADVRFTSDAGSCEVVPLYADVAGRTPYFSIRSISTQQFGPSYPAP